jgi:WD40 repeat protein
MAWSPNSEILVGSGFDSFQAWNVASGTSITDSLSVTLYDMAWRPHSVNEFALITGNFVASYTIDQKLEGKFSFDSTDLPLSRFALAWDADGVRLIVAGKEDAVRVWDGDSGELLVEIPAREHFIQRMAFVSETQAVGVTEGGAVVLADFETQTLSTLAEFDATLIAMAWNPRLARLDVGGYARTIHGESAEVQIDGFVEHLDLSETVAVSMTP